VTDPAVAGTERTRASGPVALVAAGAVAAFLLLPSPVAARSPCATSSAKAAIVVDQRSGEVLCGRRAAQPRPVASATKLMTALLLLARSQPADVLTAVRYRAAPVESKIGLRAGERLRARDLLTALLLESANDAAVTIAHNLSGSRHAFVRDMNLRARELGLRSTTYSNPIGLDSPRNRSSAGDLAALSRRLMRDPVFARTVDRPRARLRSGARTRTVRNRNTLVATHRFVNGIKTGHTLAAGYVLVGAGGRGRADVVSVVLGAPSEAARNQSTLALLRWGLDRFRRYRAVSRGRRIADRRVAGRADARVALEAARAVTVTALRGRRPTLRVRAPREIAGPLPAGRRVGSVEVRDRAGVLASTPLVTAAAVPGPTPLAGVASGLGAAVGLTSVALLAILSVVTLRRARARRRRPARVPTSGR
jgi:D-alanyl-D-alanine carboxypeptidase (penicillin-binding protein 5/6)